MLIKQSSNIKSCEITDPSLYLNRRQFLFQSALTAAGVTAGLMLPGGANDAAGAETPENLQGVLKSAFSTDEKKTPFKDVTHYNNYYEFGTDKYSPAESAKSLVTRPWTVEVGGEVMHPKEYDIDELMKMAPLEERVYRP